MIIVTGGAGFIGSNLLARLNAEGHRNILVVDDLSDGWKFRNLKGRQFTDYEDRLNFINNCPAYLDRGVEIVFHLGACANTRESDGQFLMQNNYQYGKMLADECAARGIPMVYASSASVYGARADGCAEDARLEDPLTPYGFSKLLLDRHARRLLDAGSSQLVGLRLFNVYGPNEGHKGPMASVVSQFARCAAAGAPIRLFASSGDFARDFIQVDDVIDVLVFFLAHREKRGIFNLGSGIATTFAELVRTIQAAHPGAPVEEMPFPAEYRGVYQEFTRADIGQLRAIGYAKPFLGLADGLVRSGFAPGAGCGAGGGSA